MKQRSLLIFLLWVLGCCGWIGYWIWHYATACRLLTLRGGPLGGRALACNWKIGDSVIGETAPLPSILREILVHLQVPICALIVGLVLYWVVLRSQARAKI